MHKKIRVLVFPCGSENAVEIHNALRYSVHVEIFGASSVDDHGAYVFQNYTGSLPKIQDREFDEHFSILINSLGIDVVFATHDTVHEYLSVRAHVMGFHLVNGDPVTAYIARRKSLTYQKFSEFPWTPTVFQNVDEIAEWPVIAKPDCGQGGQGVVLVHSAVQAGHVLSVTSDMVWMEYLPGRELTVDCFTDKNRKLVWVSPRTRERVKAGISMRSELLEADPDITEISLTINSLLSFRGPWFFQIKQDKSLQWKLLEISCRVAGTMVAQRAKGINLPLISIQDFLGRSIIALPNKNIRLIERRIVTRTEIEIEYENVYIDFDETLVIAGKAVPVVLAFVYQAIADGKKIKLISRHEGDILEALKAAKISVEIFDEIIHITDGARKSQYVTNNSIFIDNHFPERLDVAGNKNIPVIDVDALEFFIR